MKRLLMLSVVTVFLLSIAPGKNLYAAPQEVAPISGKVVETMDSGGYTYVCLEQKGTKTWVAVPQMKIVKGKKMSFKPGSTMVNFRSKTLNRTFDKIIFSEGPIK